VSPEVQRLWLNNVREARPIYRHGWQVATMMLGLPLTAVFGWALLAWHNRGDRGLFRRTLACAVPGLAATLLLFWQTRTGPAAQMLSIVGAIAIAWILCPRANASSRPVVRTFGLVLAATIGLGATVPFVLQMIPAKKLTKNEIAINRANRLCYSLPALRPVAQLPKGLIFTFVDLGPRVITVTHHNAVTGPYHRNGEQIADVMNAFRGDAVQARRLIEKYHSDYLMTCPRSSTTTIFMSAAPKGFYAQLERGQVPAWLSRVPLPADSPFKLWRVSR
jgi:hypothetical protein